MEYEAVIGLEVHAQLSTESKIFCGCSTRFGAEPNTQGCPVCLGMPGVLPVLNRKVVEYALKMALAVGAQVQPRSRFLRKNYFYPDLPKNYQISQYQSPSERPLAVGGGVEIEPPLSSPPTTGGKEGGTKLIRLVRVHMEEDAGKSVHDEAYVPPDSTFFDVNRCGVPLLEIVSEPDLRSGEEAYLYLTRLRQLLLYLGICDGNMEEGSIRIDTNISVRRKGEMALGTKCEIKNMNSFRNVQRALDAEAQRQIGILEAGEKVGHDTLLWDARRGATIPMRTKEHSEDYRYFPEPDLVPVEVAPDWLEEIRRSLPELPEEKRRRFVAQYGIPAYDAEVLTASREVADYYEACVAAGADPKLASNWVMGDVLRELKSAQDRACALSEFPVTAGRLAAMLQMVTAGKISGKIAKTVFEEMVKTGEDPQRIVERQGLAQISDAGEIEAAIERAMAAHPKEVERYRAGQRQLIGFFVGQVMKETRGKANPKVVNEVLRAKLEEG